MTEIERIARELEEAHGGTPWHGPSRASVLADITPVEASWQPSPKAHSIWALVLHMSAWTGEVTRRLREGDPRLPAEGDWPAPPPPSSASWRATLAALADAHRGAIEAVRTCSPARLDQRAGSSDDASVGGGVTCRVMLHGLAQHDAYHTGQIAMLKRILRDRAV